MALKGPTRQPGDLPSRRFCNHEARMPASTQTLAPELVTVRSSHMLFSHKDPDTPQIIARVPHLPYCTYAPQ